MHSDVKGLCSIGNCPFDRNRALLFAPSGLEQERCLNAVVVSERDNRRQTEFLDLRAFKMESKVWGRWRRPVTQPVVHSHSVIGLGALLQPLHELAHVGITAAKHRQKFQRLS